MASQHCHWGQKNEAEQWSSLEAIEGLSQISAQKGLKFIEKTCI